MICGNGLSIDLSQQLIPQDARLDTSCPLEWKFRIRAENDASAEDVLRELHLAIDYARSVNPSASDFEIIEILSRINSCNVEYYSLIEQVAECGGRWIGHLRSANLCTQEEKLDILGKIIRYQLRLFLCAAFAHFDDALANVEFKSWNWSKWIKKNRSEIKIILSLNYDRIMERTVKSVTCRPVRYLHQGYDPGAVNIFKPHGSIDFRVGVIKIDRSVYWGGLIFELNDTPIDVVQDVHSGGIMPDIVLPMEYSKISDFQFVKPGYERISGLSGEIDRCVLAGVSYWEQDRPELDRILDSLSADTAIVVVNPASVTDLMSKLGEKFHKITKFSDITKMQI